MNNFFITGLPRSRTAWLSNFLTTDKTFCYHELLGKCGSIEEYNKKISCNGYTNVGDANTSIVYGLNNDIIKDSPLVIITNNLDKSIKSICDLYNVEYSVIEDEFTKADEALSNMEGLHIEYDLINDSLEKIWNYCIGSGYDEKRAENLIDMNIQTQYFDYDFSIFKELK